MVNLAVAGDKRRRSCRWFRLDTSYLAESFSHLQDYEIHGLRRVRVVVVVVVTPENGNDG